MAEKINNNEIINSNKDEIKQEENIIKWFKSFLWRKKRNI